MDQFKKKCLMFNNTFKLDVEVINENFNPVLHITDDTQPSFIIEARKGLWPSFKKVLNPENANSFCIHTDNFHLSYMASNITDDNGDKCIIIIGPFIREAVTDNFIWDVIKRNHLANSFFKSLENYYKTITVFRNSYLLVGDFLVNLCVNPLVSTKIISGQKSESYSQTESPPQEKDMENANIKTRYDIEKRLMHAIETGNKEKALEELSFFTGEFLYRVPGNPLRARKNIAYTYGCLLRISAEKGGVTPEYLHLFSEKFAYKVENAVSISEIYNLELMMIEEYCDLVKKLALKGHSPIINKALKYIHMHFDEPINLQITADAIGFDRTYLAKQFRKEMNISVIDYINKRRIEEAVFLIDRGELSITEISTLVGFNSYNYFCKVFKDIKGMTCTEYKKQ